MLIQATDLISSPSRRVKHPMLCCPLLYYDINPMEPILGKALGEKSRGALMMGQHR